MRKALLVLAVLAAACAPEAPRNNAAREIVIGEYGSMTGPEATFGQSTHEGIMLAVDEINRAGGIHGRTVRVVTEDDQSKAEEAANAVAKLISSDNVIAVLADAMRRAGPDFDSTKLRDAIAATKDFPVVTGAIALRKTIEP